MDVAGLFSDFITLFYPRYCYGCNGSLVKGEEILCTHCIAGLPKTDLHVTQAGRVKNRLDGRLPTTHAMAFLKFKKGGIVQHLLHELKYNNRPEIGVRLGALFGNELKGKGGYHFDLIIPVPLHESRKRKRGYNQSAKFAEGLSSAMLIPWDESVSVRRKSTATQTKKSRHDRWKNVKDVFAVKDVEAFRGRHVLLVDDVITTGATIEACGQHLIDVGCELSVACIAEAQ